MRGWALTILAVLASGCASRADLRALQAPPSPSPGVIRFDDGHQYRGAVALEWIGGVSRKSYLFAEPNQRVIRPIIEDVLASSGLRAGTTERARYGLRVNVEEAHGPAIGGDFIADFAAIYVLVNRATGAEVWRREIRSPGVGYFLTFDEGNWQRFWSNRPISAFTSVANPLNFFPFASDSAADRARRAGLRESYARASAERDGRARAAHANYAAVATNAAAFLHAFAADNGGRVVPILPCWGSPAVEAYKQQLLATGGDFATDNCTVPR